MFKSLYFALFVMLLSLNGPTYAQEPVVDPVARVEATEAALTISTTYNYYPIGSSQSVTVTLDGPDSAKGIYTIAIAGPDTSTSISLEIGGLLGKGIGSATINIPSTPGDNQTYTASTTVDGQNLSDDVKVTAVKVEVLPTSTTVCEKCSVPSGVIITPASASGEIEFSSDDPKVAYTSGTYPNVQIIGVAGGTATISATLNGTALSTISVITVVNKSITSADTSVIGYSTLIRVASYQYGRTDQEYIDVDVTVCRSGNTWKAVLEDIVGHYSSRRRLLGPQVNHGVQQLELGGPGIDTTQSNFCEQLTNLYTLGSDPTPVRWYVLAAVNAHEDVHESHMGPALKNAAADIEEIVEGVSVNYNGQSRAEALTELVALPQFAQALRDALATWERAYNKESKNDHNRELPGSTVSVEGDAYRAEYPFVITMHDRIVQYAKDHGWNWQDCPYAQPGVQPHS